VPRRFFTAIAWLLVALWLPAALHCMAATAEVFGESDCCSGDVSGAASDSQSEADHCQVLESGAPREEHGSLRAVQPLLLVVQRLADPLCILAASREVEVSSAAAVPPELVRLWRAVERVVAFAQAP
jgi:hypothetical protein